MRDLSASEHGVTPVAIDTVYAFLEQVERYPQWYPNGVKQAVVRDRDTDGGITKAFVVLALNEGPIRRDFEMEMSVKRVPGRSIVLSRLPKSSGDKEQLAVSWALSSNASGGTDLTASFNATLSIPGFLPLGGIDKAIPRGFLAAALAALRS
jgi:ribosome-associated toxin RatA of RatAB toxin-antitoxin module